jgi:hypothetical protein
MPGQRRGDLPDKGLTIRRFNVDRAIRETKIRENVSRPGHGLAARYAIQQQRDRHVLGGFELRYQVEGLENEADAATAEGGLGVLVEVVENFAENGAMSPVLIEDTSNDRDQSDIRP